MAYRKPAVTVIQEFVGLVPALASFSLPTVAVGPAFQLVSDDLLGTYTGSQQEYAYASKQAGAIVDLELENATELFPATKKPISVKIVNAEVEVASSSSVGIGSGTSFTDATTDRFSNCQVGDQIVISSVSSVAILAAQSNGVTSATVGQTNRLTAGTSGQFVDVKVGDAVIVTAGTNTNTGTFYVTAKPSDSLLILDFAINTGGGASTNVAYSISGDRGNNNAGVYRIKEISSANAVVLESPLIEAEHRISYIVKRSVDSITLDRVSLPDNGFEADADKITITSGLEDSNGLSVISGSVKASYRALRNDMAANVREFARLSDLQAFFGVDQISPANPLAFALSIMLQNTTTPVNGLGLDSNAIDDETLSYQNALDVLALTEMYALVPLTQSPVIHQLFKTHAEGLSQPANKKERVAIVNRLIKTEEVVSDPAETSTSSISARIIVNTQVDGSSSLATSTKLNDATTDAFLNVELGDTVVIVGGTNAIGGEFSVTAKNSSNQLTLSGAIVTGTSSSIQYYIVRKDGLGANGITLYDRNASFITSGVAAGHIVKLSGPVEGSFKIAAVTSEKQLELSQVPGVVSLETGLTYEVVRTLSKTEQAAFIQSYSSSVGSRRVVNVWPDVVKAPVGSVVKNLPGFYAACAVGAMTTGLPTQQGFTNLTITGFLGFEHSTGYFSDAQMDIMADGGTFIFAQEGDESPLYVRHQLTTDRSAIKFQEYSVTKNCDYVAKFIRNAFKGFIGVYNIVDSTMDELKGTAKAVLTFLQEDTRLPRIGGVIRAGQLSQLAESETQIDTVIMRFSLSLPIPLNNLDITIEV